MNAYWKDTFREIIRSLGRYVSLIVITALGAAAVAGILATSIDMRAIADKTFKRRGLYDIQIKSTTGFEDDDISALEDVPGVGVVMPTRLFDAYAHFGNETRTIRTFALPESLNAVELIAGRLPENSGECAVEQSVLRHWRLQIGDTIRLGLDDMDDYYSVFKHSGFTITGVVLSPFFIIPHDRGMTSLGDGTLNYYMYLHPDAYELDVYTDVYVVMERSREMDNLSEEYYEASDEWASLVELAGDTRVLARKDEFADAQTEIDDGWAEYYDGWLEYDDGWLEYNDGLQKYHDGWREHNDGLQEYNDGWLKYDDGVAELNEKTADARKELRDAGIKLEDAKNELKDAFIKLEDAQITLDGEIADALKEIDRNERELLSGVTEIEENRAALESGQSELDQARESLLGNLLMLESMGPHGVSPELDMQYDILYQALGQIEQKQAELDGGRAALDEAEQAAQDGIAQIYSARMRLEQKRLDAQAEIDDGWVEYYNGLTEYEKGLTEWRDGLNELEREEYDALAELEDARNELDDARIELDDALIELEDARIELEDALAELEVANNELEDARIELEDAQSKLDDAPVPEWFYFARKDDQAFDSYYQDTMRLEGIGYVFPLVFFIVAVLVSLTTMSRMVDEQRTQAGIYKALGYGTHRVVLKLLVYAFSASLTGGLLGAIVGSQFFPRVIFGAYLHMYDMPPIETPVPVAISAVAIAVSVSIVMAVTVITCIRSMSNTPAELMRPKTPPSGKRVLIERISFIWNRLKFTSKVTARNIFRYKKRFIMTLAGVAGCTALLLTSFGLRDSMAAIAVLQYGKLLTYTSRAYLKEIKTPEQRADLDGLISGDRLYLREEPLSAEGSAFSVSMLIPESADQMSGFVNLYSRRSGDTVALENSGILVTEKLAREVGVAAGETLRFTTDGGGKFTVLVTGVVENYVMHHIYMSPDLYEELFGAAPLYNSVLTTGEEASAGKLLEHSGVRAVVHLSNLRENTADSTDAMEVVAIVLIFLACALAFVVLFNLTNINIIERIRELATIKVLGFYNTELSMYIYRENALVTLMGIVLGLVCGVFLHGYVLAAAEIDLLMFPRTILPLSYVYSVALSVAFAVFVNLVMNFKLARINMVESLKSVE